MTEPLEAVEHAPSAFVSYAHDDQEFVLALIDCLHGEGLGVRYDRMLMRVGDSLIGRISEAIVADPFLVAVISPNSVKSEWCRKELSIAMTKGIKDKSVTVLPVKHGDPEIPPMLTDIYYADADRYDIATVAKELADSMRRHLAGDSVPAPRAPTEQGDATGGTVTVNTTDRASVLDHLDEVAKAAFGVFEQWGRLWGGGGNVQDIANAQRPLKWALGKLPDEVRVGLPSVADLADAGVEYFERDRFEQVEADLLDELHSVRRQVDQGLDVTKRWTLSADLGAFNVNRDGKARLWEIQRGDEKRRIQFFISGTVLESADEHLPSEVAEAKKSEGRSAVMSVLAMDDPPENVVALSTGISFTLPD